MQKSYGFAGDKMLYQAQKRDFTRSKMSPSKRLKAWSDAEVLTKEALKDKEARERQIDRVQKTAKRDDAMETVIKSVRQDGSIKKFVL